MPTLRERFVDLSEDAPASPIPEGIWRDGRRRARARRVGTAVVVAATVVGLVAIGGPAAREKASPGYANTPGAAPALPSTIHEPSQWLSTGATPPGQLSMVIPTKNRSLTGYTWGLVGVSATTGAYRFLDLPDYAAEGALSPDGRHYAYWVGSGPVHDRVVSGLAVYDTTTGHVDRWSPGAGEPIDPNGLAWNGNEAVTFVRAGGANLPSRGYVWELGSSRPRPLAENLSRLVGSAGQAGLYSRDTTGRHLFYLDPATSRAIRTVTIVRTRTTLGVGLTVSPSGRRIAGVHLSARHSRLLIGRIDPDGRVQLSTLRTSLHWPTPLGWADDRHLLAVDQVFPTTSYGVGATVPVGYALTRVEVRTGRVTTVASMGSTGAASVDFADDLLGY